MIIRVKNAQEMLDDISEFLNISRGELFSKIITIGSEATKDGFFESSSFKETCEAFLSSICNHELESIYFCHLMRADVLPEELLPLEKLLTTINPFSEFLNNNGIRFTCNESHRMDLYYCDKKIDIRSIENPDRLSRVSLRLGQDCEGDFCVNGYAFAIDPKNSTDGYYQMLRNGPELIRDLDDLLGLNLVENYCNNTSYYNAVAIVPLDTVIFDQREDINIAENKTIKYLSVCFELLYSWFTRDSDYGVSYNEMLRMPDQTPVKIDHFIKLED